MPSLALGLAIVQCLTGPSLVPGPGGGDGDSGPMNATDISAGAVVSDNSHAVTATVQPTGQNALSRGTNFKAMPVFGEPAVSFCFEGIVGVDGGTFGLYALFGSNMNFNGPLNEAPAGSVPWRNGLLFNGSSALFNGGAGAPGSYGPTDVCGMVYTFQPPASPGGANPATFQVYLNGVADGAPINCLDETNVAKCIYAGATGAAGGTREISAINARTSDMTYNYGVPGWDD